MAEEKAKPKKKKLRRTKIKIGVKPNGKPLYKWISGKSKAELEGARQHVKDYYITGTALRDDRLFGEYLHEWYKVRKDPFISESTRQSYRVMINKYVLPAFGDRNLRAVQAVELQEFLNGFAGKSNTQITQALSVLRGVFSAAEADRLVQMDPAKHLRKPIAAPPEEKRALTDDERERVKQLFTTHEHSLYLAAMYYTGIRPGEARGLQWGDFDFKEGLLHIQRDIDYAGGSVAVGDLKSHAADRYIPIADEFKALLCPLRGLPGMFLFANEKGKPLGSATAARWWVELMAACGMAEPIPEKESKYSKNDMRGQFRPLITPHAMRHNFITMCWEQGMDVMLTMKLVGHADYQTTMNIYTHLSRKHLDTAKDKLNEIFSAQKGCTKVAHSEDRKRGRQKKKP